MEGKMPPSSKSNSGKAAIEVTPAIQDETVHLGRLEPSLSLTDQCGQCHLDLKRCNIQAQRAVLGVKVLSRDKFEPIVRRLRELDLRLSIWSTDCGASEGYLENIRGLSQRVGAIFGSFHAQLETAAEQINDFRKIVPKRLAENIRVEEGSDVDALVERHISDLKESCDEMSRMLSELCVLQPLIHTAQALDQKGPQRELRKEILQLKSQYPQDARSETRSSVSTVSSREENTSDKEDDVECAFCSRWFPFGTLDFHQDLCSAARVYEEAKQSLESPLIGQSSKADMLSPLSSGSKPELLHSPVAMKVYETPESLEHASTWPILDIHDGGTDEDSPIPKCSLFRILMIGRSCVGKSTLLSMVFNIPEQDVGVNHSEPGRHSVWQENTFSSNAQLVIHEGRGFEAADTKNLDEIKNFISHCAGMTELERQLHCIWYCIDCTEARLWSEAEKEFFAFFQKSRVPLVFVLTKFDIAVNISLLSQVRRSGGEMTDWQEMEIAAEIEAKKKIEEKIQRPLEKFLGTAINTETVSNRYPRLIEQLIKKTTKVIEPNLKHLWIRAQQANAHIKREEAISSSIEMIRTEQIRTGNLIPLPLIKSLFHRDFFKQLHHSIRTIWNVYDGHGMLERAWMIDHFRHICQVSSVEAVKAIDVIGLLSGPQYARAYLRWSADLIIAFEMLFWRFNKLGRTSELSQNPSSIMRPSLQGEEICKVLDQFRNSKSRVAAHAYINERIGNLDFSLPFNRKKMKSILEAALEMAVTEGDKQGLWSGRAMQLSSKALVALGP